MGTPRIVRINGNYYLIRDYRDGRKKGTEVLARYGHERPALHAPDIRQGDCREILGKLQPFSVHLAVTSPPYFGLKEGTWRSYEDYIALLDEAWRGCFSVLDHGCRLCVNVGDQYTSIEDYGRHKAFPIHADVIKGAERAGFDYMGMIVWDKAATLRSSGGGSMIGSGATGTPGEFLLAYNFEFVLLFKKPGRRKRTPTDAQKAGSKMTSPASSRERKLWYDARWSFPGEKKSLHPAPFPVELPHRLIRMFTFVGDTVLDPFMGSGTTLEAAARLARRSIGIDIEDRWCEVARSRVESITRIVTTRPAVLKSPD